MLSISRIIDNSLDRLPLDRPSCQLLGPTGLVVQALMGVLAVLSLVYKRHRETQKRPWKIWLFDVSKQVAGQMFVHGLNVLISDLGSHHSSGNACTYYFLNILLDTTLGVGLIYLILQSLTWLLSMKMGIRGLKMGQYGNPPSTTFWIRQAAVYVCAITTMKFLVVALFAVWPGIYGIGDWLLSWTIIGEGDAFQVVFVMGIFPIIMNIIQFWLIDSIVKASTSSVDVHSGSPRNSDSQDREPLFNAPDDDDDDVPRDIESVTRPSVSRTESDADYKTLIGGEDDISKVGASGSSSPATIPKTPVVAAHDYPPNSISSASSLVSHASSRSRHKYKQSAPPPLDIMVAHPPAINSVGSPRNSSRNLIPQFTDDTVTTDFDAWEKGDWVSSVGVGLRPEQTRSRVTVK